MGERYPERKLIPFAKRSDSDDVACFEIDKPGTVQIEFEFIRPREALGWRSPSEVFAELLGKAA